MNRYITRMICVLVSLIGWMLSLYYINHFNSNNIISIFCQLGWAFCLAATVGMLMQFKDFETEVLNRENTFLKHQDNILQVAYENLQQTYIHNATIDKDFLLYSKLIKKGTTIQRHKGIKANQ